jgi:GNAT superfamily N-acetyltransferase
LATADLDRLASHYGSLSDRTRAFWHRNADARALARDHCDAIDQFDKLRLVADDGSAIVAVVELSFSIPDGDHARFAGYGVRLDERTDVRFGPCVRDDEQGSGLAIRLLAETARIAQREGRSRLILWGGVQPDNRRARRFYEREGFSEVGRTPSIIDMVLPI